MQKCTSQIFPFSKMEPHKPSFFKTVNNYSLSKDLPSRSICGTDDSQWDRGHKFCNGFQNERSNSGGGRSDVISRSAAPDVQTPEQIGTWLHQCGFNPNDLNQTQTFEFRRMTPLLYAASLGLTNVCKYFIDEMHVSLKQDGAQTSSALFYSCGNGHLETSKFLLKHGQLTDMLEKATYSGLTPFAYAVYNGHLNIVKWIIRDLLRSEKDLKLKKELLLLSQDCEQRNAMELACSKGNVEMARWIFGQVVLLDPKIPDLETVFFDDMSAMLKARKVTIMSSSVSPIFLFVRATIKGFFDMCLWLISIGYAETTLYDCESLLPPDKFEQAIGVSRRSSKYDQVKSEYIANQKLLLSKSRDIVQNNQVFRSTFLLGALSFNHRNSSQTKNGNSGTVVLKKAEEAEQDKEKECEPSSASSSCTLSIFSGHDGIRRLIAAYSGYQPAWMIKNLEIFLFCSSSQRKK
jgi:hypothetical protein